LKFHKILSGACALYFDFIFPIPVRLGDTGSCQQVSFIILDSYRVIFIGASIDARVVVGLRRRYFFGILSSSPLYF